MKWLFWLSFALLAYTYAGYALCLWMRSLFGVRKVARAAILPSVSVVMIVRNEEDVLEGKLRNLLDLDYAAEKLQLIVVSDGSTDGTESILRNYASNPRIHALMNSLPKGKASGVNDAMEWAQGEIIVFTDARQSIEANALQFLTENFADPQVGCVSGELMLGDAGSGEVVKGTGLYWRIEKWIRERESSVGSVVGATGALYAARRELVPQLPPGTILDDVYIPMCVARGGARVVFDERARAWDAPDLGAQREFERKVRTLSGNYQLLQIAPWLLSRDNAMRFQFVSHKLLRLLAPFALAAALISTVFLPAPFYRAALVCQIIFYALSFLGMLPGSKGPFTRMADAAYTFVMLNAAAVMAFGNFVTSRKEIWIR
jgi:poly-beta-1,6-N-acetyl-D-glucosamine synthase